MSWSEFLTGRVLSVVDAQRVDAVYDFVIIGAGSAGSVMANRLTEVADWNVLLLEAGGDETILTDAPLAVGNLQRSSKDWQYKTVPQTANGACLAFVNNQYDHFETKPTSPVLT